MILITGVSGQLGWDVALECDRLNIPYIGTSSNDLDITNSKEVDIFFEQNKIDSVIHCAAYTAVDAAEDNQLLCFQTNVSGTQNLIQAAQKQKSKFVFISTDYVFDGEKSGFYEIDDKPNPIGIYAQSKYDAEQLVIASGLTYFIVRISWVFGLHGKNFIKTMLRLGHQNDHVKVVSDQIGSPTYTKDAAQIIVKLAQSSYEGIYHVTNEGYTSWANFAQYLFMAAEMKTKVLPIKSMDYPTKAKRPKNSCLSKQSLLDHGYDLLPTWQDAVDRFIIELKESGEFV